MPSEEDHPLSAVVLLSAGLDSTYNLILAARKMEVRLVLTFDYGQKAARREVERAQNIAQTLSLRHQVIELPWFKTFTTTSLISEQEIPSGAEVQINDVSVSKRSATRVWVPNRNGIFLNIAAGFAEGLGAQVVVPGFNLEEAETFPDNSAEFLKILDRCFTFSTSTQVRTHCYSSALSKTQIVKEGVKINLPFSKLWPCYLSGEKWCGTCESCLRFERALAANGLEFDLFNGMSQSIG